MSGVINALKLGWRSLGDDALRATTINQAVEKAKVDRILEGALKSNMSGRQVAEAFPKIQADATNFLNDFHAAYKQPTFDSVPENIAYNVSRKVGGVANSAGQMVQGMGGIPGVALQAAFIAPMFMGGMGQPQPTEEELQQQQLMQSLPPGSIPVASFAQYQQRYGNG